MKKDKFYILMFSVHGLLRYHDMELGRDADTGGQIKYVVELAEELCKNENVKGVDLFTRFISEKNLSDDYSKEIEQVSDKFRIVRIQCGGKKYIRKELLWPHLDEYIDKVLKFLKKEEIYPDIIHGHYADAGYVGMELSKFFSIPFIFTGHSLGRSKKKKLIDDGMNSSDIEQKFNIEYRIAIEEEVIKNADIIVTSTKQEVTDQYGMYVNNNLGDYFVIPPGVNLDKFYSFHHNKMSEIKREEGSISAYGAMIEELNRFFIYPDKPLVLSLCRAEKRKNISGLIHAYGQDKELQAMANLAIFAGLRKNITDKEENEKNVLTEMLLLMDKYDLYGMMAIPKKHDSTYEVPELYRITAEKKGVFVNVALTEPFGLTLIESLACGLPVVATNDGGPRDIIANCKGGILVDALDVKAIINAIKSIIADTEKWKSFSSAAIRNVSKYYKWSAHVDKYLKEIKKLSVSDVKSEIAKTTKDNPVGDILRRLKHFIITDIDDTLFGDAEALDAFMKIFYKNRDSIGFGVASGRTVESIEKLFNENNLELPYIIISSVGSEIHYTSKSFQDKGWQTHLSKKWDKSKIKNILDKLDFIEPQPEENQRTFKISYYMAPAKDRLNTIHDILLKSGCYYNLIYSNDKFLDILPYRASKGKAIRYISYKWDIPLDKIMACGDSGNDVEMFKGSIMGLIVGNYKKELESLRKKKNVFFSDKNFAYGIIDGMKKYGLI
ncbi:MAG: HAD-IIB family hydrolase [Desulfobacterales bacterium]|nr:HAD-IIB family hydrolase [Desulfobacterales bacterium]